uniref:Uncharacterized protein n=1 Tax=Helianthus annuus TaxID=4232 RepID=A0A251TVJ2_HELAN
MMISCFGHTGYALGLGSTDWLSLNEALNGSDLLLVQHLMVHEVKGLETVDHFDNLNHTKPLQQWGRLKVLVKEAMAIQQT